MNKIIEVLQLVILELATHIANTPGNWTPNKTEQIMKLMEAYKELTKEVF